LLQDAANAVQESWPRDTHHLEQVLWPSFSKYSITLFNKLAEARLGEAGSDRAVRRYVHWLRCTCITAVVEDLCRGMRFSDIAKHAFDVIGEVRWPERAPETRRALARLMTEVLGGPHSENLEKRLRVLLDARIGYWEAKAIEKIGSRLRPNASRLNIKLIRQWIDEEGYDNEGLADALHISRRAVSSLRNDGGYHGDDAVTKLANLMGRNVEDLYLS
jgi:hypothetical protein